MGVELPDYLRELLWVTGRPGLAKRRFRIVRAGPRSERGGMIACTRCRPEVARPRVKRVMLVVASVAS